MRKVLFYIAASLSLALAGAKVVEVSIHYAEDPASVDALYVAKQFALVAVFAVVAAVLWSKRNPREEE